LHEAESGKLLATFQGHSNRFGNAVVSAVFSPDGRRVLTASDDTARLWPVLPAGAWFLREHGKEDLAREVELRGQ